MSKLLLAGVLAAFTFLAPLGSAAAAHPASSATTQSEVRVLAVPVLSELVKASSVNAYAALNDPVDPGDPCADPNACPDPDAINGDISWWWGSYCAYIPRWALSSVLWYYQF